MNNLIIFVIILVGVLLAAVEVLRRPWHISGLTAHPAPAKTYAEAASRIEALRSRATAGMNPLCALRFYTHGQQTENAIILVHGYTNCPQQFDELGKRFFARGWNVLIAPLPHHGLADRMTGEHANLKAEEVTAYADEVVDIAQGLGKRVCMLGISLGGVTTAWAAQFRTDLDLAVCISPAFGFKSLPTPLTAVMMNAYSLLPDKFEWWNPETKDALLPPLHAYPRYSMHALTQTLRLGCAVSAAAARSRPAAKRLVMVLNENDQAVNNELSRKIYALWQAQGMDLASFVFEASLGLGHDLIDPSQTDQQIEVVYPRLLELTA